MVLVPINADVPPPDPPVEERRVPVPAGPLPERGPAIGLTVVAGLGNPDWAHLAADVRYGRASLGLSLGSIALAHNLGVRARGFLNESGSGPFVQVGATLVQLAETTPNFTPRDLFFTRYLGAGWRFDVAPLVFDVGAGLISAPARSAAPPGVLVSSSEIPHFILEAGYAF